MNGLPRGVSEVICTPAAPFERLVDKVGFCSKFLHLTFHGYFCHRFVNEASHVKIVAMVYCCVPFCQSWSGQTPGMSFHQFPADQELCAKWQKTFRGKISSLMTNRTRLQYAKHFFDE